MTLQDRFASLAESAAARAPLVAKLSELISQNPELAALLNAAPEMQRQPVLLLAALHDRVLAHPQSGLAAWYRTARPTTRPITDPRLRPTLEEFVLTQRDALVSLIANRSTQTNEVGRCALFLPALGLLADELDAPLAHLDVGTSAGLNLLLDRFHYRYVADTADAAAGGEDGEQHAETDEIVLTEVAPAPAPSLGSATTARASDQPPPVTLQCSVRGSATLPATMPTIVAGRGIDPHPIDVTNEAEVRWLEACVWSDQIDRFERLTAAIEIARTDPPHVMTGDAVDDVEAQLAELGEIAHPVITTSWVLSYFTADERLAFTAALDRAAAHRDLSWVIVESPLQTPELPGADKFEQPELTAVTLVRWRNGERSVHPLATAHPHGYWLHWRPDATVTFLN